MAQSEWDPAENLERCRRNVALIDNQNYLEYLNSELDSFKQCQQESQQQDEKMELEMKEQPKYDRIERRKQRRLKEEAGRIKNLIKRSSTPVPPSVPFKITSAVNSEQDSFKQCQQESQQQDKKMELEMKEQKKNAKKERRQMWLAEEANRIKNKMKNSSTPVVPFKMIAAARSGLLGTWGVPLNSAGATVQEGCLGSLTHNFLGAPIQQCGGMLGNHSESTQVLAQSSSPSKAKYKQNALCLYTNWILFHNNATKFFESQRSLLAMVRGEGFTNMCGIQEADHLCHRTAADILQRVEEIAGQLQSAQVDILIQNLVHEKELNEQLKEQLKELKDEASEFAVLTDNFDHSELAERLEFQMARLADKDSQIAELKERLAFQNRDDTANSNTKYAKSVTYVDTDEDAFHELSAEAVLDLEPRSLIRHIRTELGIGMDSFNPVQRRIIQAMRGKLGCALEKLAHDIYSNDSQIVLELIQNADDNYYSEVMPFLSICIRRDKSIFVTNNECGFNNANVVAISNIGGSTKKDVSRFTGHKGIGFKSVFKVTRTPYIISKEFSFRFNLDGGNGEDNIGYILPEWVEREVIDSLVAPERIDPNMTHFYFPLSESSRFPAEELYQGIDLIPLFLRQLHHIELGLDCKKKVVAVNKQPRQNGLLEIYHLIVTEHTTLENGGVITEVISDIKYRIYRKVLDVPKDLQVDPAGRMIPVKTELILAFPTIAETTIDPREVEIQKVYSYLPVEKAGFRFLIQADFHLVSSRDRIHAQSLYNRWLSTMIPPAFKEAFGLGGNAEHEIRAGALRNDLFLFLPTPYDLTRTGRSEASTDGFWRRVMKGIRDKVLDTPCVLTESSKWAKPNEVCVRPKGCEDLFTNSELQKALNKEWVCKSIAEEAVYGLGCQYLSPSEALAIISHPSFCVTKHPKQWFYQIYGFLGAQIKNKSELIDHIFCAKMFPLDTGVITSLQDGPLYTIAPAGLYKIGPHVLRLLAFDSAIFVPGDPARTFLESVGITSMTALDVANSIWVEHQRLAKPISSEPECTAETSCEQFWEQLRFLKDHWSEIASLYPYLESKLFVPVYPKNLQDECVKEHRVYYHFASFVYFSDLKSEFDEICPTLNDQVLFLNDQYLNEMTNMQEKQAWIKFLTVQIGINKSLRVIPTDNKDYACSQELDLAIQHATKNATENDSSATWAALLVHMQKNWEHFKKVKYLIRQIKNSYSGFRPLPICSLFPDLEALKNLILDKDGIPCICLPAISGLTNINVMMDLEIETTLDGNMLRKLVSCLEQPGKPETLPIMDVFIWKNVYAAMVKHNTWPKHIFIPENNGTGKFANVTNVFHKIPPMLQEFCDSIIFPANVYVEVQGMEKWFRPTLTIGDMHKILFTILKIDVVSKREYEMQILQIYHQINELVSDPTHGCKTNLVLDKQCFLRGWKTSNRLVMPDRMDIFKKFVIDPKNYCPILFVHPELAKLENIATHLSANMNIPLLSKVVQTCPVPSFWQGYYVFAIGTTDLELPTYLSSTLTNLYRTLLAEFQAKAKTLSLEENFSLGNLLRGILVFVLAVDAPKVPVAYTIYGVSRVCHEDYFIHKSVSGQVSVIVSAKVLSLPIEEHVNLNVLKQLFPPLVVDDYLKTVIKRMLEGSVKPKLETQNIVQPNDELQLLPFQVIVEDSEVVKSIHENRQKPRTSRNEADIPNQRKYPIIYAPQGKYFGADIPGVTTNKAVKQQESQSVSEFLFPALSNHPPTLGQTTVNAQQPTKSSMEHTTIHSENAFLHSLGNHPPTLGQTTVNAQQPTKSSMEHTTIHSENAFLHSQDGVSISRIDHGEKVSLSQRDSHNPFHRIESTNSDSLEFLKGRTVTQVTDQFLQQQSSTLPQNTKTRNASLQPCIAHSSIGRHIPLDLNTAVNNPPNAANQHQDNDNINTTAKKNSESNLPQAFGGNVNSFNATSSIRQIRNEIHSWPKIPVEDIEARLFKGSELQYANTCHHQLTPNTDSSFGKNLRQLENEGLVAKLIGIWAEKAVYNHFLHLYNSRKPLQNGSKTLGFPIRHFSMKNWISSSRENFDTEQHTSDDSKGFDFFYEQVNGTVVYIEVKGHAAATNTFLVSSNEWEVAKLHSGHTDVIYVILGINLNMITMEGARIEYFLEDPILLEQNGTIAKKSHSYVIELHREVNVSSSAPNACIEDICDNKNEIGTMNVKMGRAILRATRMVYSSKDKNLSKKLLEPRNA